MNDFDRTQIDSLKAAVDLVEVFRATGLEPTKKGRNWMCRCPFHADTEASLSVNPEAQLWNCFGCDAGGDVLNLLQLREGLSFAQAIERLRELAGRLPAPKCRPAREPSPDHLEGGYTRPQLLERVADLYHQRLLESPEAREYLASRGLEKPAMWVSFRLGYADGSLLSTLPGEGPIRQALLQLGVLNADNKEHLRGCVVVPLEHPDLGVVGLYGRRLGKAGKGRHVYLPGPRRGVLNWQSLKLSSRVVLAEGVLDALSLWSAGVTEATCLHGTQGLPPDLHELLVRQRVRETVLCLDGDAAGQEAGARLAGQLAELGLACRAAYLSEGRDPNQLLCENGPEALRAAVTGAQPVAGPVTSPLERAVGEPELKETGDGFLLRFGDVSYRVSPRPPFSSRLRVTLRAARGERVYLDTVDLYLSRARSGAIKQLVKRLELSVEEVEGHLVRILDEAESWVLRLKTAKLEETGLPTREPPQLTDEEREEALAFLRDAHLSDLVLADMEAMGYVGEENAKLLVYLIGVSRKLERPLSGIVRSQSGAGKSSLTELVERLTPEEDVFVYSRLSAQALGYFPDDYLVHKLLIVEERVGVEAADYAVRVLQSRQKLSQAVVIKNPVTGQMQTQHFEVRGPIAYLETTTEAAVNHENATRCFEIDLDESEEQTRRIHQGQRERRAPQRIDLKRRIAEITRRHQNAQRLLEPVRVFIPYVDQLSFPSRWLRTRRDNERFLSLVEAVAFLHQHQRKRGETDDGTPYVLASVEDYQLAYCLVQDVLASTLHELTRDARDLLGAAREWTRDNGEVFTRRDLREHTGVQDHRLRAAVNELVEMEYAEVVSGSNGRAYQYRLLSAGDGDQPSPLGHLTTPQQLQLLLGGRG